MSKAVYNLEWSPNNSMCNKMVILISETNHNHGLGWITLAQMEIQ